jgi:DNA-binding transcriptional MocR family regulator
MTSLTHWREKPLSGEGPAYDRILARLERDIRSGALAAGARLPTQRALAEQLGVGLGTITRAYTEAEARGLIEAVVGRGSFVARLAPEARADGPIDLAKNIVPQAPTRNALRAAIAALVRRSDLFERLDYAPEGGFAADRAAGAEWLTQTANLGQVKPGGLVVTAGAQQAIHLAMAVLCRPGDAIVFEQATFYNAKTTARHLGLRLVGAEMDGEGLTPDALEHAVRGSGARAAYVQPFQNPTARVMGRARREQIVATARRLGIILIEDDLYAAVVTELGLPPLRALAPDIVAYVSGISKGLAPGLRTGYLLPPERYRAAICEAQRAVTFGAPTLGSLIGTQWIESGEAFRMLDEVRRECAQRTGLAGRILAGRLEPLRQHVSPHVWLPLSELESERVAGQAARAGVQVTPPQAPFLPGVAVNGLRLCLGGASDLPALERALEVVKAALDPGQSFAGSVV